MDSCKASRTISRFLYPRLAPRAATIPLGRLLRSSSDLPGSRNGAGRSSSPIWSCSTWGLPCRRALPQPRCALTAPFHPYRLPCGNRRYIFCGTFRKTRFERVPPAVSRHAALWRPDFPLARSGFPAQASGCPSGRPAFIIGVRIADGQSGAREFRPALSKSSKHDETHL